MAKNSKCHKRQNKKYETTITRGPVKVNAVPYYTLINKDIGYIVLSKFNKKTTLQTKNALEDLKLQGATRIKSSVCQHLS